MIRIFGQVLAGAVFYIAFCGLTLGYYVSPEEWLTGTYKTPAGHACLAYISTCRKWFPRYYISSGDSYSYDTGGDDASYDTGMVKSN